MGMLDLHAFAATTLATEPFPYLIVPGFLKPEARSAVLHDYPKITEAGSFPTSELEYGRNCGPRSSRNLRSTLPRTRRW
jgi:SM-20-related protein